MTDTAKTPQLTDDELLAMRRLLDANSTPERNAALDARVREQAEAERLAAYNAGFAASAERAARDPNAQALFAKAREQAKADRAAELAKLRTEADIDTEADVEAALRQGFRSNLTPCARCGRAPLRMRWLGAGAYPMCLSCHARGRLHCEQCGTTKDSALPTSWCPADQRFRCPKCLEDFGSRPLPKPRFVVPRMGSF
jgi:hypothetical protein